MKHKILLVLLLSSMACITATAQKVSMDFRQVKLAKVFDAITQQTGLTVAYSRPTVNPDKLVTVRADEEELAHVLDRLLAGMGVTYEISGKKVYLKAKAASEATHQSGKVKKISGVIVDEKGEPVIGASIAVKGTSLGTITNVDGEYTLMGVPEKAEVVISFRRPLFSLAPLGRLLWPILPLRREKRAGNRRPVGRKRFLLRKMSEMCLTYGGGYR